MPLTALDIRRGTTLATFAIMASALAVFRRTLFLSSGFRYPSLAAITYIISPGGEMMIDSWNDHQPLVPFMVTGLAALLGFRAAPRRASALALAAFGGQSILHAAEPWLWGCGVFVVAVLAWNEGDRRALSCALALAAGMVTTSVVVQWSVKVAIPPDSDALDNFGRYMSDGFDWAKLDVYWSAQTVGGPWPSIPGFKVLSALGAGAGLVAVAGTLEGGAAGRQRQPDRLALWAAWTAAALVFPAVYETDNPERYWTLSALWSIVVPYAAAVLSRRLFLLRRVSAIRRALLALGLFSVLVPTALAMPGLLLRADEEQIYLKSQPDMLRSIPRGATLVSARKGTFFLFAGYFYAGRHHIIEHGERAIDVVASLRRERPTVPVAVFHPVVEALAAETTVSLQRLWQLDSRDYDTRLYLLLTP